MILSIIGSVVHFLVNAYILVLFVRMILDWVLALSPTWRPSGIVASLFDAIYQLTEPPLRWLRQYIRPVPLGPIYFDVAYLVLYHNMPKKAVLPYFPPNIYGFVLESNTESNNSKASSPKRGVRIYGSVDAERY